MRTVTLSEMRDTVRERANNQRATGAVIDESLNQYIAELYDLLVQVKGVQYFKATDPITITSKSTNTSRSDSTKWLCCQLGAREHYAIPRALFNLNALDWLVTDAWVPPSSVLAKLDEVARVPQEGVARTVDENQRHQIIQSLLGKPAAQIAITAHLSVEDSAEYAKALATPLMMVGWQIDGNQVRRAAPKSLEPVQGLAVVVRDRGAVPQKALQLRAALTAAHIGTALVSDPGLAADATLLWIGRRVVFTPADPAK
jgi:hypothetical protein